MDIITTYLATYSAGEVITLVISVLAVFGIVIDTTPVIKLNPMKWLLGQIGKMLNDDTNKRIDSLEGKITVLDDKIEDTRKKREEDIQKRDMERIKEIRLTILDFANCISARHRTEDECLEIFELDQEYIGLLSRYELVNGRTTKAMEKIQKYYDTLIENEMKENGIIE